MRLPGPCPQEEASAADPSAFPSENGDVLLLVGTMKGLFLLASGPRAGAGG